MAQRRQNRADELIAFAASIVVTLSHKEACPQKGAGGMLNAKAKGERQPDQFCEDAKYVWDEPYGQLGIRVVSPFLLRPGWLSDSGEDMTTFAWSPRSNLW